MPGTIVSGRALICDADTIIPSGALCIEGDRIVAVGSHAEITGRFRAQAALGSAEALAVPGFVNAHGKGITDFRRGALDDHLEIWKFRGFPPAEPRLDTLWAGLRLLENGVTTTMHNHNLSSPEEAEEEFAAVIGAHRECGLRLTGPGTYPGHDPADLLVYRGSGADVDTVLAGGGRHTRIEREEVKRKLAGLKKALADWFAPWAAELEDSPASPFYRMNDRAS